MGYAYTGLIPAAVLFSNPGITKEKFIELLDSCHSCWTAGYSKYAKWGSYRYKFEDKDWHQGLEGLAKILRLEESAKFKEFEKIQDSRKDERGLWLNPLQYYDPQEYKTPKKYGFKVIEIAEHISNELDEPRTIFDESNVALKVGDVWTKPYNDHDNGASIVTKIFSEILKLDEKGDIADGNIPFIYEMEVRPIRKKYKYHKFKREQDFFKKFPWFHPEFRYDFSQRSGTIYTGAYLSSNNFKWIQKDEKYYLDEEATFNSIPASTFGTMTFGYTDLILTAEAIKQKAWKLFSYKGKKHMYYFLRKFRDSRLSYERAVWDSHTCLWAKQKGMTNNELLRQRLYGFVCEEK